MAHNNIIQQVVTRLDQQSSDLNQTKSIKATNDIDAIKTWLTEFVASNNTFTSYRQTAERFVMWALQNNLTLASVSREDIQIYQDFLANPTPYEFWCGAAVSRANPNWKPFVKGLSPSSIRLNLQILTTMYEYLLQSGYLATNPFRLIKRKSARLGVNNRGIERYLTHKEWGYVLEYIEKLPKQTDSEKKNYQRTKWIFNLLYLSGCRRSEICNAKMSDFVYKHGGWWLSVVGKGNKYGEIPIPNALLAALIEYRRPLNLPDYPNKIETNISLVNNIQFKASKIIGISDSMLYKTIKATCYNIAIQVKEIDPAAAYVIERVSTHWLRHTSATHQVDAGIDIRVVKENLRHSLLETTMRYQHMEDEARLEETIKKFGVK